MNEPILHHYPMSPFAEKVRAVLGYKGLAWRSVIIPNVMPKPDVQALTGGYRRTPVLQIGADIYCDTALICTVLDHHAPERTLYPDKHKGLARVLAQWADGTLFWAAMGYNLGPKGAASVFTDPQVAKAFGEDRGKMSAGNMTRLRPGDAAAAYRSYLRRLSDMLDGQDFLLGSAPSVADFAAYTPLWFTRTQVPVMAGVLQSMSPLLPWMDRMAAFGHGSATPMSSLDAIQVAAASTPAVVAGEVFQDEHGIPLGSRVTVTAETFGTEATEGELLAATRMHYTLRRTDPRAGTVHVHFPRIGYVLRKADSA